MNFLKSNILHESFFVKCRARYASCNVGKELFIEVMENIEPGL